MSSLSSGPHDDLCEVRWHGRGGQGAITSANFMAQAAYLSGFRGVTSAPSFGAERRGAPVTASTRLSHEPVRMFSQIEFPHVVVVLDETLLECERATAGLREGGWLVVNSRRAPGSLGGAGAYAVATADATTVAKEVGLFVAGVAMVSTAMLGAVVRATELVTLDSVKAALEKSFPPDVAKKNFDAARITYERTTL